MGLPQLTLNAKNTILLMVMFAFVVPAYTKTKDYVLMLTTHNDRALHINDVGKVTAANIAFAQPLTMDIVGDPFNGDPFFITLYAKQVGLFLCFRRGRLVGLKQLSRDCHFSETMEHGHYMYANAYNATLRVGFTKRFKPIGPKRLQHGHIISKDHFLFERRHLADIITSRITATTTTTTTTTTSTTTTTTRIPKVTRIQRNRNNAHNNNNNDNRPPLKHSVAQESQQQQVHKEAAKSITNDKHNDRHSHSEDSSVNDYNSNNRSSHSITQQQAGGLLEERLRKLHRTEEHPLRHDGNTIRNKNRRRRLQNRRKLHQQHNLQTKNLVRQQHHNSTKMARRRQHEREQLLRKQSRHRQQLLARHEQHQREQPPPPARGAGAAASSTASTAASALTATAASLVPTTLIDIMALLAASRRKRGRRKKDNAVEESENATASAGSGAQGVTHAADMQIAVAQTKLPTMEEDEVAKKQKVEWLALDGEEQAMVRAQRQTAQDAVRGGSSGARSEKVQLAHRHRHHHQRPQTLESAAEPVSATQHVAEKVAQAQAQPTEQQTDEYSNSYVNSNLNSNNKLDTYTNANNGNDNDYVNAIPALPKNYLYEKTHQHADYDVHSHKDDEDDNDNDNNYNNQYARAHSEAAGKHEKHEKQAAENGSHSANGRSSSNRSRKISSSQRSDSINPSMTDYSSNGNSKFSQPQKQQQQQPQHQTLIHNRLRYRRRAAATEATNEAEATTAHDEHVDNIHVDANDDVADNIVDRHVAKQHQPDKHAQQQVDLVKSEEAAADVSTSAASFEHQTKKYTNANKITNTNKNTNININTKTNIINANKITNTNMKYNINIDKVRDNGDINVNTAGERASAVEAKIEVVAAAAAVAVADDVHTANLVKDNNVKRNFFGIHLPFFRQYSINNSNINNNNNNLMHFINNNINMDVVENIDNEANANQINANAIANAYQPQQQQLQPAVNNNNDEVNVAAAVVAAGNVAIAAHLARAFINDNGNRDVIDANYNNNDDENVHAANIDNINNVYEQLFAANHKRFFRSLNYANTNHNVNNYTDDNDNNDQGDENADEWKRNHNKYDMTIVQYRYVVVFY
ncbi:uncharacterized protein DDB_G0283357 isoform X2 [Anastrepha ludens]|uniref:uncharacterized protein DDB_G0283357 isoform X2 n=1 Tax=Anastrepha ludens TaxID=28586 RepID=UPI0023B03C55|nr:uncharacterized protein DDB_G0283357 isoform X2 [Anastrepha ludens]